MKIGILTYFRPINFGAFLQAYALSHRLNQEDDMDVEIIDFHMPAEDEYYERKLKFGKNISRVIYNRRRFKTFREALKDQTLSDTSCCTSNIQEFTSFVYNKYDIIIAGSDEIWCVDGYRGLPAPYFLPGDLQSKKVSYAASSRTSFDVLPKEDVDFIRKCIIDFDYIGVRDQKTACDVDAIIAGKCQVNLNYDPSFIYDFSPNPERGRKLLKDYFHLSGQKKVIAVMSNESLKSNPNLGDYLKNHYGEKFDFVSIYNWSSSLKNCPDISPLDWVDLIASLDGVISTFYHGVCFSIITGTPFYAIDIRSRTNSESKLYDLLRRIDYMEYYSLGLKDAFKQDKLDDFMNIVEGSRRMNFSSVLNEAREEFDHFINILREIYVDL